MCLLSTVHLTLWLGNLYDDITVWTRFDQRPARKSRWIVEPNTRRAIIAPVGSGIDSSLADLFAGRIKGPKAHSKERTCDGCYFPAKGC